MTYETKQKKEKKIELKIINQKAITIIRNKISSKKYLLFLLEINLIIIVKKKRNPLFF
mgnify:CR=1 FL=1